MMIINKFHQQQFIYLDVIVRYHLGQFHLQKDSRIFNGSSELPPHRKTVVRNCASEPIIIVMVNRRAAPH